LPGTKDPTTMTVPYAALTFVACGLLACCGFLFVRRRKKPRDRATALLRELHERDFRRARNPEPPIPFREVALPPVTVRQPSPPQAKRHKRSQHHGESTTPEIAGILSDSFTLLDMISTDDAPSTPELTGGGGGFGGAGASGSWSTDDD